MLRLNACDVIVPCPISTPAEISMVSKNLRLYCDCDLLVSIDHPIESELLPRLLAIGIYSELDGGAPALTAGNSWPSTGDHMSSLDPHQAAVADSFDSSILHVLADVSSRDVGGPPQASSSSSSANKATGTRPAAKAHEAQPPAKRKRSKKVDDDDEMPPEPEKKSKACHACRRVKVRLGAGRITSC